MMIKIFGDQWICDSIDILYLVFNAVGGSISIYKRYQHWIWIPWCNESTYLHAVNNLNILKTCRIRQLTDITHIYFFCEDFEP